MNRRGSIRFSILAAALVFSSMALGETAGEPADHSAHHPDQQAQPTTPQMQPNPQMMGGCPNMMGQGKQGIMDSGMMALA